MKTTGVVMFGAPHLTVLGIMLGMILAYCWAARMREGVGVGVKLRAAEFILAGVLCVTYPVQVVLAFYYGRADLGNSLPLHLCDVTAYLGAVALVWRGRATTELVYFWGIAGTLQAMITPAGLGEDFPHPGFFIFFVHHGCIVVAAVYVVVGRRDYPQPGAVRRVMRWSLAYVALVSLANYGLGTNYGFLHTKPEATGSLLDLMGPWPWYVLWMLVVALLAFFLLNLPFSLLARRGNRGRLGTL